jgi:hypothetical protein
MSIGVEADFDTCRPERHLFGTVLCGFLAWTGGSGQSTRIDGKLLHTRDQGGALQT